MNQIVKIDNRELTVKEWKGQRVVTFKDIDQVHERVDGTAQRNFIKNKKHLKEGEDYFVIKQKDVGTNFVATYGFNKKAPSGTLLTEMGYLMIVKSLTDKKAWEVQRKLVNSYFKLQQVAPKSEEVLSIRQDLAVVFAQINEMESTLDYQHEQFKRVMDNMTLTTRQQEKINSAGRKRVNKLLGGAHSEKYKQLGRTYMANLWICLKERFRCGSSYKDLNPTDYADAIDFINNWNYVNG